MRLTQLIHPAPDTQVAAYQVMGLRKRVLTLPMMALVVSLIGRHVGAVSESVRVLNQEGFLWTAVLATRHVRSEFFGRAWL